MDRIAVELNDTGLLLARSGADGQPVLDGEPSPGFAVLHAGRVLVGTDAARRQRLAPLHAQNRYWHALGLEALPWSAGAVATAADLAHAHLTSVLTQDTRGAELLLAVPPGYTREQLGLLVGIANECGVVVRGLVDAGLAALTTVAPSPCMLHLDLQLHQASATLVELARAEGTLRRTRYELLPGVGQLAFNQAMASAIAAAFVRDTRFDPLHQAASEQRLHDQLPAWLQALATAEEIAAELELGATTYRIQLTRAQVISAVDPLASEVLRLVQLARPAGALLHLCFTPRIAAIPGLVARLSSLRDCVMVELAHGAAATGTLLAADTIVRAADAIVLVHRLPLAASNAIADDAAAVARAQVPAAAVPTHVLFNGRAWPITLVPLTLGWSVGAGSRALTLPAGIAGVSRSHCTLQQRDGQAVVTDHSTYGTFVNDERVGGHVVLQVGDVLRLGAPGVALELIRVLADHVTP
jgi:FHA domain